MLRRRARRRGRAGVAGRNGLSFRAFKSRQHAALRRRTAALSRVPANPRRLLSGPRRQIAAIGALPLFVSSQARVLPARALMSTRVNARALRARPKRIAPLAVAAI